MENETGELKARKKKPIWAFILGALLLIAAVGVTIYAISSASGSESETDLKKDEISRRLSRADRYLSELKYDEAIAEYTAILKISPKCTEAYVGVANVYKAQDNYPAIIQFLEDAKEKYGTDEYPAALERLLEEAYEIAKSGRYQEDWTDRMLVYGDAEFLEDGSIMLTNMDYYQKGCIWLGAKVKTELGFALSFSYWAGGGRDLAYGGADGFTIALADKPSLGEAGGDLGFPTNAVGFEIDSYPHNENDPESKHFALIDGSVTNHIKYVLDDRTDDSEWHTVVMLYHNNRLEIYLDEELLLYLDDANLPKESYIGITASTGSGVNFHFIKNFLVTEAAMIDEFDDSLLTGDAYIDNNYDNLSYDYYDYSYDSNSSASISVSRFDVVTVSMTADSITEYYTVGNSNVEEGHAEYSWNVTFSDGANEFRASIDCWHYPGMKTGEISIYDMQRSLWYNGYNILNIDDISLSGNTVTLSFRIPKKSSDVKIPKVNYSNLYITNFNGVVAGRNVSFAY